MIINNFYQNQISFEKLPFKQVNGLKMFEEVACKTPLPKKSVHMRIENGYAPEELLIKTEDSDFLPIGISKLTLKNNDTVFNDSIHVVDRDKRHSGTGSIMHLGQIMTMLENNIKKSELLSLGHAIYFHAKFKYMPAFTNSIDLEDYIALDILSKKGDIRFNKVVEKAEKWLKNSDTPEKEKVKSGNEILSEYIQTVIKNKLSKDKDYEISPGFEMVLTKENIMKNKEYFNDLFKKFNIDYSI